MLHVDRPANNKRSSPRKDRQAALKHLALAAQGMTGADIARLIRDARGIARRAKRKLRYHDILEVLDRQIGSVPPDVRWQISVHEAGHALVFAALGIAEVQSVSTGRGDGGATSVRWPEVMPQTENGVMQVITCYLAGRAAETLIFGESLIGHGGTEGSDLEIATTNAVRLETVLGCSQDLPLLYIPSDRPQHDLRYDRDLAARVNKRLELALAMATAILGRHQDALLRLARELDHRRYLDGAEVREILALDPGRSG
jgi:cell division protease FtsH